MNRKYIVQLSDEERAQLQQMIASERDQQRTSRIKPTQEHCDRTEIKEGFP